jgi:membrane protein
MGALNRIYRTERERPWARRVAISLVLAIAVGGCLLLALLVLIVGHALHPDGGAGVAALVFFARWTLAGGLLLLAVGLLVRHAPAGHQPIGWVSFGSSLVVGFWLVMSIGFSAYLRAAPPYSSVFGSLALIVLLIAYLYLSSIAFLVGAQVDAMVRAERDGSPTGQ